MLQTSEQTVSDCNEYLTWMSVQYKNETHSL